MMDSPDKWSTKDKNAKLCSYTGKQGIMYSSYQLFIPIKSSSRYSAAFHCGTMQEDPEENIDGEK